MTTGAVFDLTCELIARESVSPNDGGCQTVIAERLQAAGFEVQDLPFEDVSNLWARRGSGGPLIAFAGHTDVVPTGGHEHWSSPPFEPTVSGDYLYGRGAADMKSSLAAMVVAAERFVDTHPDHAGSIGFLITSDEEDLAVNGTVKVVEHLTASGVHIDQCVVGEPSSTQVVGDVIRVGRRGSLNGTLRVSGTLGHVAYPHLTRNPVHECLAPLADLATRTWDDGNEYFPPTTFQISNINAGTGATNVIPGGLEVAFNFRFNTSQSVEGLQRAVEQALANVDDSLDCDLSWRLSGNPFLTQKGPLTDVVCAAIAEVSNVEAELSTSGGTSDGRFIAPTGTELIELGPVNASIHKIDEHVRIADLDPLADIYYRVLVGTLT